MLTPRNIYTITFFTVVLGFVLQSGWGSEVSNTSLIEVEVIIERLIPETWERLEWYKGRVDELERKRKDVKGGGRRIHGKA